ncbi:MAG: DUF4177 domain-containing protein [candidate division WOR-3 bacterium]
MQKWEYKTVSFGVNLSAILKIARWELETGGKLIRGEAETVQFLNQLGAEGWELVTTNNGTDHNGNITKLIMFFKRPVPSA